MTKKLSVFWFRRDLRLDDNIGLYNALRSEYEVLPLFIFDTEIISELPQNDSRITFIHKCLQELNKELKNYNSSILILKGKPIDVWKDLINKYQISEIHTNKDYEPYAITRDNEIKKLANQKGISFNLYKDQVIFEENEILKADNTPYTVFTPYKNKWRSVFSSIKLSENTEINSNKFTKLLNEFPSINQIGFSYSNIKVKDFDLTKIKNYASTRDIPSIEGTTNLSPHLRFGTVSIRKLVKEYIDNEVFINELIWREFFMQILFHFPQVVDQNFKLKYNAIEWRNNEQEFEKWCEGKTGYPIVDAGMRELNQTGYMHNRVRMITAGFLCKHLLIDWRWGEAYFAQKLLDYELSANNGNWQWASGTGCDAAPYFRIFNPYTQAKKFDPEMKYIKKYIPEINTASYPNEIVEHKEARQRAIDTYKKGIANF